MNGKPQNSNDLILAADELRQINPAAWARFVRAYSARVETLVKAVVTSPSETIFVTQGKAQFATDFRDLLLSCEAAANALRTQHRK